MSRVDEAWDWAGFYYFAKATLSMTDEEFWACTPRKLLSLMKFHSELSGAREEKAANQKEMLKQFMNW